MGKKHTRNQQKTTPAQQKSGRRIKRPMQSAQRLFAPTEQDTPKQHTLLIPKAYETFLNNHRLQSPHGRSGKLMGKGAPLIRDPNKVSLKDMLTKHFTLDEQTAEDTVKKMICTLASPFEPIDFGNNEYSNTWSLREPIRYKQRTKKESSKMADPWFTQSHPWIIRPIINKERHTVSNIIYDHGHIARFQVDFAAESIHLHCLLNGRMERPDAKSDHAYTGNIPWLWCCVRAENPVIKHKSIIKSAYYPSQEYNFPITEETLSPSQEEHSTDFVPTTPIQCKKARTEECKTSLSNYR